MMRSTKVINARLVEYGIFDPIMIIGNLVPLVILTILGGALIERSILRRLITSMKFAFWRR